MTGGINSACRNPTCFLPGQSDKNGSSNGVSTEFSTAIILKVQTDILARTVILLNSTSVVPDILRKKKKFFESPPDLRHDWTF